MSKREASAVFIFHQNKVLLLKRNKEPYKHCWTPPGGKLEEGESTAQAALREVFEETNLQIIIDQSLGSYLNTEQNFLVHFLHLLHSKAKSKI